MSIQTNRHHGATALLVTGILMGTSACSFYARSTEEYKSVTRELVDTKKGDIGECYDVHLQSDAGASGKVVVNFTVEKKTGQIVNPNVVEDQTKAPAELGQCIVRAIDGLTLDPADQRDGIATFTWVFEAGA